MESYPDEYQTDVNADHLPEGSLVAFGSTTVQARGGGYWDAAGTERKVYSSCQVGQLLGDGSAEVLRHGYGTQR